MDKQLTLKDITGENYYLPMKTTLKKVRNTRYFEHICDFTFLDCAIIRYFLEDTLFPYAEHTARGIWRRIQKDYHITGEKIYFKILRRMKKLQNKEYLTSHGKYPVFFRLKDKENYTYNFICANRKLKENKNEK